MAKDKRLTIEERRAWAGFSFITPWIIGFFLLYLYPLLTSLATTFCRLDILVGKMELSWMGFGNYIFAFRQDPTFVRDLIANLKVVAYDLPGTLVFSMVVSLLLTQKFKTNSFFKVIFFLPIIMSSGIILQKLNQDAIANMLMSGERSSNMFKSYLLQRRLEEMGLTSDIIQLITGTANSIFSLALKSSVQILLFIAGLQSISPALYEAAAIDGCTAWEKYWKITFPMLSPIILIALIYTLTDNFISSGNSTMNKIIQEGHNANFAYGSTLAWIYFVIIGAIIGLAYWIFNRRISYIEM